MNLHEYQAKRLFRDYGLPVSEGVVISAVGELADALTTVGGKRWVVKAQVHAGGRGKAGGVRLLSSRQAAEEAVRALLGTRLVTYQTDNEGQPVNQLLIEAPCDIDKELYLSVVIDRSLQRLVITRGLISTRLISFSLNKVTNRISRGTNCFICFASNPRSKPICRH